VAARSVSPPANRRSSSHGQEPNVQGTLGVSKPTRKRKETPVEHQRQYVGIDLHRRRSVIVRINDDGEVLETVRVVNDPLELALAIADAGEAPEVALEATYGWVRHEAPHDRVGERAPPAACRSRPLKLEAA
jgi:hypothetical protein